MEYSAAGEPNILLNVGGELKESEYFTYSKDEVIKRFKVQGLICMILTFLSECSEMQGWHTLEDYIKKVTTVSFATLTASQLITSPAAGLEL